MTYRLKMWENPRAQTGAGPEGLVVERGYLPYDAARQTVFCRSH